MSCKAGIALTVLFLLACTGCSSNDPAPAKRAGFDFIENFASGSIWPAQESSTPTGKPALLIEEFSVGGEKRHALITLASAKIVFEVPEVTKDSRLTFGVGMNTTLGDGAEGIISVEAGNVSEVIYQRSLDPITRAEDRKWFDESVDFSRYAGKAIKVTFETKPGSKGDAVGDWVAWSTPFLSK